jgi:GMP synthase-like glutamine amidotransferase
MNPLKILVIDNNRMESSFGAKNLVHWSLKMAPTGSTIVVRRAPGKDLPAVSEHFDAIVISGSMTSCLDLSEDWTGIYDDFVMAHLTKNTPILGVCYGHQTLARCLAKLHDGDHGMRVAPLAEFGWQKIRITGPSRLFAGLGSDFVTYESHFEEVVALPPGMVKTAESDHCDLQAFEMPDRPVFGIQFHPEYTVAEGEESLANKIKKGVNSDWIFNPGQGEKLYDENVGKVIFGNFFRIASSRK